MYNRGSRHTLEPPGGDRCRAPDRQRCMQALPWPASDSKAVVHQLRLAGVGRHRRKWQQPPSQLAERAHAATRTARRRPPAGVCTVYSCGVSRSLPLRNTSWLQASKGVVEPQLSTLPLPEIPLHVHHACRLSQLDAVKPSLMPPPSARLLLIGVALLVAVLAVSGLRAGRLLLHGPAVRSRTTVSRLRPICTQKLLLSPSIPCSPVPRRGECPGHCRRSPAGCCCRCSGALSLLSLHACMRPTP